jgi:hypothetical protein
VRTDGWSVYAPLAETFGHQSIAITRTGQPAHVALPGVHRVASLLKRWLTGTLHYGYSIDQLDYYLDEFTFRFNRRTSRSRGLLFYRLLQQAVATDPHPYRDLTINSGVDLSPGPRSHATTGTDTGSAVYDGEGHPGAHSSGQEM